MKVIKKDNKKNLKLILHETLKILPIEHKKLIINMAWKENFNQNQNELEKRLLLINEKKIKKI